jgi:hypothetical protein
MITLNLRLRYVVVPAVISLALLVQTYAEAWMN